MVAMDRDPNLYGQDSSTTGNTKVYDTDTAVDRSSGSNWLAFLIGAS